MQTVSSRNEHLHFIWFLRFIGGAEMLGGIGLILPAATHILPWLTVAAAIGLVVLMLLAAFVVVGRLAWTPS